MVGYRHLGERSWEQDLMLWQDVLTSWGHHALKSLNPSLHYILAKLFVNLHIIFESMDGTLCSYHLNETSFAGFIQSLEFLKKSWNLSSNFLDLEKVWKMRWSLRKLRFFFQSYNKCFISEFFSLLSNLIQSRPYVCSTPWKKLCSCIIK